MNPNVSCQNLANFPINVSFAFGGLLEDKVPLVCGGYTDQFKSEFGQSKCFTVESKEVRATLTQPRFYRAGVVISKLMLWGTGGTMTEYSTDLVSLNQNAKVGPELPIKFLEHCVTKINDTHVILIGGIGNAENQAQTLLVDISRNFSMSKGPSLNRGRYDFSCGSFQFNDKTIVIAAGGYDNINSVSTELWDLDPKHGWIKGPSLLEPCSGSSMVSSPNGQGVIILGCREQDHSQSFYQLYKDRSGMLSWRKMIQKLKYPRSDTVAMLVPDEIVSCEQQ